MTTANYVKAIRVFFRHALKSEAAKGFKVPKTTNGYKKVPTREEMQRFYKSLPNIKYKALFLFYASSGRRKSELLEAREDDLDKTTGMLAPLDRESQTKHTWISFVNQEALDAY